jgi:hypothetical protein
VTPVDVPAPSFPNEQLAQPTRTTNAETNLRVTREAPGSWR